MNRQLMSVAVFIVALSCKDQTETPPLGPSLHRQYGSETVLVDPSGRHGSFATIQAGIDAVTPGGRVLVRPGSYGEALMISKGLTLQSFGADDVIIAAPSGMSDAIYVATSDLVVLRDLTIHAGTVHGIQGVGAVNLEVERTTINALNPVTGVSRLLRVLNDPNPTGTPARLVVRHSTLDGGVLTHRPEPPTPFAQVIGIAVNGDVTGLIERNDNRHTGGNCVWRP